MLRKKQTILIFRKERISLNWRIKNTRILLSIKASLTIYQKKHQMSNVQRVFLKILSSFFVKRRRNLGFVELLILKSMLYSLVCFCAVVTPVRCGHVVHFRWVHIVIFEHKAKIYSQVLTIARYDHFVSCCNLPFFAV